MSNTREHIQTKTYRLQEAVRTTGLVINITETKILRVNASQKLPRTDKEGKARINKARQAFATHRSVWEWKSHSWGTKLRQFNSCEKSDRSPSPLPSRAEGGNGSYVHYRKSKPASPAKPWKKEKEKETRKTSPGREKNFARRAKDHQHDLAERSREKKRFVFVFPEGTKRNTWVIGTAAL